MSLEVPQIVKELREEEKNKIFYQKIDNKKKDKTIDFNNLEKFFQSIINHSDDLYFIHDINNNLLYVSPQSKKIFGYYPDEMLVKWTSLITDNPINEIGINLTKKCIETGEKQKPYILEAEKKSGEKIFVRINESPIKNESGEVIQVSGILRDVTEDIKQKEQIEKLILTIERSNMSLAILDLEGKVEYANPKLLDVYGVKLNKIIGKHWSKWLSEYSTLREKIHEIEDTVLNKGLTWTGELNDKDKNGNLIWRESTIIPIKNQNGKIINTVYTSFDITDRKKSEENLKASEEKYRLIFNNVNDVIAYLDKYGKVLDVNPRCEDIFGFEIEDLIGKNFSDIGFFKGAHLTQYVKLFKKIIIKKESLYFKNIEIMNKSGNFVYVDVSVRPILENGKILGIVAIIRNVTEQKKAEEETIEAHKLLHQMNNELESKVMERTVEIEKLLKQKDEFIKQLGHDLKSPLNPLVNLLPIIENEEKNNETKDMLKIINRNVGYMKNLVVKTIELAYLNSPNTEFNFEDTNLLSEINKIIETNKILFEENNMQVVNNVPSYIQVSADKLRLDELINNLLNNSVTYKDGKGKITIDAKLDGNYVTVSISDDGIGMTSEELSHVFDEFYKADLSRHYIDSSGLGLSISKRIVEHHGGYIWVESKGLGKGSKFSFTLRSSHKKTDNLIIKSSKRINLIQHKGKEIIYLDYSNLWKEEYEYSTDEIVDFISNLGKYDLLILTNVDGNFFNIDQVKNTRKAGAILKPYIKKNAIIGISKTQQVFLKAVKLFSGLDLKPFNNIEDAKDWLVE